MKWIGVVLLLLLVLPGVLAIEPEFVFTEDQNATLPITCFDDITGQICDSGYSCTVTVSHLNGSILLNNETASLNGNVYEITLSDQNLTRNSAFYQYTPHCTNQTNGGTSTKPLFYLVNPSGVEPSQTKTDTLSRSIWVIFGVALLLLVGGFFVKSNPIKWSMWIFGAIAVLVTINLVFVTLQDEIVNPRVEGLFDFVTAASWYFYWFAGGLILIIWFLTVMNVIFLRRTQRTLNRFGGDY